MDIGTIMAGCGGFVALIGGVIGVIKAIKGLVQRTVKSEMATKIDAEEFYTMRNDNEKCHSEIKKAVAVVETKVDEAARVQDQVLSAVLRIEKNGNGGAKRA